MNIEINVIELVYYFYTLYERSYNIIVKIATPLTLIKRSG